MSLLVLNIGSSSLKFALFTSESHTNTDAVAEGKLDFQLGKNTVHFACEHNTEDKHPFHVFPGTDPIHALLDWLNEHDWINRISTVAHRIVHGGTVITEPTIVDSQIIEQLNRLIPLAPLHLPKSLNAIQQIKLRHPNWIQTAFVDTAFFNSLPEAVIRYPIPLSLYSEGGIRKFGFHGISHQYCSQHAAGMLSAAGLPAHRIINCHIGSGCSITALRDGEPIDTTMGFTPMDGLMMATRSGSIDPGILIYLQRQMGWSIEQVDEVLNRESGLAGASQISSDYRELIGRADTDANARVALQMFTDRIRKTIGAYAVQMNGLDALVFTAGIGENSAVLRQSVCHGLECLGVQLDEDKNSNAKNDGFLQRSDSQVAVLRIATQEEKWIAQQAFARWEIQ